MALVAVLLSAAVLFVFLLRQDPGSADRLGGIIGATTAFVGVMSPILAFLWHRSSTPPAGDQARLAVNHPAAGSQTDAIGQLRHELIRLTNTDSLRLVGKRVNSDDLSGWKLFWWLSVVVLGCSALPKVLPQSTETPMGIYEPAPSPFDQLVDRYGLWLAAGLFVLASAGCLVALTRGSRFVLEIGNAGLSLFAASTTTTIPWAALTKIERSRNKVLAYPKPASGLRLVYGELFNGYFNALVVCDLKAVGINVNAFDEALALFAPAGRQMP